MADRRVDELARRAAEALDCQVLHRLGQGGMAVVVLAEERSADLQAALSTLLERLQLFQFETAREAVLQMLMAVSRDDLPAALTHLERLYHRFRTLARVLPPSR